MIVTATHHFNSSFIDVFKEEIPILSANRDKINEANLVIFTGGEDINPQIYGEENKNSYYNTLRDSIEIEILEEALKLNKKILGVCRGHQLINAFLGGKLVQDLYFDLKIRHGGYHELIYLTQKSIIKSFFKNVNSIHHQGVIKTGENLIPTSEFKGVIESCENDRIITVQFHPEWMGEESTKFFKFIKYWKDN